MRTLTTRLLPLFLVFGMIGFVATTPTLSFAADDHAAEAAKDGEKKSEGASGLLNPNYGEAVWNLIVFLIVLAILGKFVLPVIRDGLKAREEKLEGDLVAAEKAKADADAALVQYKAQIADAQKEAQKVIEEAKKSADQVAAKLKADAQSDITKMKERAEAEIASAKEQALGEVYAQAAELSTQIAGRILKREINAADQEQLVSESLAELTQSGV